MPKYAFFENSGSVCPVIGWYDTDVFDYGTNLPQSVFEMTQEQWDARLDGLWAAQITNMGTSLIPYTPPPPEFTPAQQAQQALAAGVSIVSTGHPAISGVYPMTPEMRADITAEVVSLMVNQTFTNGGTVIGIGDINNDLHNIAADIYPTFATAYGKYVGALRAVQISNDGTLPSQPVTIA